MTQADTTVLTPASRGRFYAGWRVVLVTLVGMSSSPGPYAFASLGIFMLPLSGEFGWSRSEISSALTVLTVATALSSPVIGHLVDRIGARRVLLVSLLVLGFCMVALGALMSQLWQLLLIYGLIGTAAAGANSLPYMRALSAWFDRNRGLAIGIGIGGIGIGYAYVPAVVQTAIRYADWRYGYHALALIIFLISLPTLFAGFQDSPAAAGCSDECERRRSEGRLETAGQGSAMLSEAWRSRVFWMLASTFVTLSFVLNGTLTHLMPMLVDRGFPENTAAFAVASVGAMMAVSRVGIGFLVDRIFAPHVAAVSFAISMIGLVLLVLSEHVALVVLASLALGLSIGAETDLMAYMAGRYFGLRNFGAVYGALFAAILAGTAIGPLAFGIAFDTWGSYVQVLVASIVLNLLAVLITMRLGPFPGEVAR